MDLAQLQGVYAQIYDLSQNRSEEEALGIFNQVRRGTDPNSILSNVKDGDLILQLGQLPATQHPYERFLCLRHPLAYPVLVPLYDTSAAAAVDLGRRKESTVVPSETSRLIQADANESDGTLGLLQYPDRLYDHRLLQVDAKRWTVVTNDDILVANILSLYLSWVHTNSRICDEGCFLDQLVAGGKDYCSPLLVNALLALLLWVHPYFEALSGKGIPTSYTSLSASCSMSGAITTPRISWVHYSLPRVYA